MILILPTVIVKYICQITDRWWYMLWHDIDNITTTWSTRMEVLGSWHIADISHITHFLLSSMIGGGSGSGSGSGRYWRSRGSSGRWYWCSTDIAAGSYTSREAHSYLLPLTSELGFSTPFHSLTRGEISVPTPHRSRSCSQRISRQSNMIKMFIFCSCPT